MLQVDIIIKEKLHNVKNYCVSKCKCGTTTVLQLVLVMVMEQNGG